MLCEDTCAWEITYGARDDMVAILELVCPDCGATANVGGQIEEAGQRGD